MSSVTPKPMPGRSMPSAGSSGAPEGGWTALIDDFVTGRWINPDTGQVASVPYEAIVIEESLEGREDALVASMRLGERLALVADEATYDVMGARIGRALKHRNLSAIVLRKPHADMAQAAALEEELAGYDGAIAVGSGTINDLVKFVTAADGRRYCVFGTAASMNGYTSTTASMTLDSGLKVSLPAHAPVGFFVDLKVSADAPGHLSAAGFGDCLARSVAQIDWWFSHRLIGSDYFQMPYTIQEADEAELNARAAGLAAHDIAANGYLYRVLTLCGLGISFTGVSNHGSMGEHQISHYIDCFAGDRHPGTLHGQQVGVASLTMARLQQEMLARDTPPVVAPTLIDEADMVRRMGPEIAAQCLAECRKKALDSEGAARLNDRLQALWPTLRQELLAFALPEPEMRAMLASAGGALTAGDLGVPADFYREAVLHCREMRNRFSMLDVADDAGLLRDFVAGEA